MSIRTAMMIPSARSRWNDLLTSIRGIILKLQCNFGVRSLHDETDITAAFVDIKKVYETVSILPFSCLPSRSYGECHTHTLYQISQSQPKSKKEKINKHIQSLSITFSSAHKSLFITSPYSNLLAHTKTMTRGWGPWKTRLFWESWPKL